MNSGELVVYKHRDNVFQCNMGQDVSADTLTSDIRVEVNPDSPLIGSFTITMGEAGGTDGEIILTLLAEDIDAGDLREGWMDIKRVTAGRPYPVFDGALRVDLRGSVTA